jgi:aryl-alcohol dehydrogenase-like predicted oxidoreductase
MRYIKLAGTDIESSVIGLGCWAIGGGSTWGKQDELDSIAAINTAVDLGITFFDTAEAYNSGNSERILGKALAGRRHRVCIATKVSPNHLTKNELVSSCEKSLKRLQTDYIDVYQIHWPNRSIPLDESLAAIESLQRDGKIVTMGVCNFGISDLSEICSKNRPIVNQLPYNLLWRAIEFGITQACRECSIGILCYSPLAQGLLTGKYLSPEDVPEERRRTRHFSKKHPNTRHGENGYERETFSVLRKIIKICQRINEPITKVALSWLLNQPNVSALIAGARNPEQVVKNVEACDANISDEIIKELSETTEGLKNAIGSNADMWQSESRIR